VCRRAGRSPTAPSTSTHSAGTPSRCASARCRAARRRPQSRPCALPPILAGHVSSLPPVLTGHVSALRADPLSGQAVLDAMDAPPRLPLLLFSLPLTLLYPRPGCAGRHGCGACDRTRPGPSFPCTVGTWVGATVGRGGGVVQVTPLPAPPLPATPTASSHRRAQTAAAPPPARNVGHGAGATRHMKPVASRDGWPRVTRQDVGPYLKRRLEDVLARHSKVPRRAHRSLREGEKRVAAPGALGRWSHWCRWSH